MASFTAIKELRLKISDPAGVFDKIIDIISVANVGSLPSSPARQTAYFKADNNEYIAYDFDLSAWSDPLKLKISDERLGNLIDLWGDAAAAKAIRAILSSIGQDIQIVRTTKGADSTEYTTLKDTYEYYKNLIEEFKDEQKEEAGVSTGRYFTTHRPRIAGGRV